MDLQDNLQQRVYRSKEAKELMEHPLLRGFFQEVESLISQGLWECRPEDSEGIKVLMEQKEAIKLLKGTLQRYVEDGKIALELIKGGKMADEQASQAWRQGAIVMDEIVDGR